MHNEERNNLALRRLVFWEPCPSPHKFDLIRQVRYARPELEITYYADHELSASRKSLGWSYKIPESVNLILAPTKADFEREREFVNQTFHLISGLRHFHAITDALSLCNRYGALYAVMSEPRVSEGFLGKLRLAQSLMTEGTVRRNAAGILAIGAHGPTWFRRAAYPKHLIFPFAYYVDPPIIGDLEMTQFANLSAPTIGYLGRLTEDKGFGVFLGLLDLLTKHANVVSAGTGPLEAKSRAAEVSFPSCYRHRGPIPMEQVGSFLHSIDLLIVPSQTTDDGWGVVVSESLMCGTPVLCSPLVGASVCIDGDNGAVARTEKQIDFEKCLQDILPKLRTHYKREEISKHARIALSSHAGATRLLGIIDVIVAKERIRRLNC